MLVPCVIYIAACSDSGWGGAYWEFSHISYFLAPYTSSLSQNSWLPKSTYFSLEIYFWVCFFFKRCPSLLYHEVSELESHMITHNNWIDVCYFVPIYPLIVYTGGCKTVELGKHLNLGNKDNSVQAISTVALFSDDFRTRCKSHFHFSHQWNAV